MDLILLKALPCDKEEDCYCSLLRDRIQRDATRPLNLSPGTSLGSISQSTMVPPYDRHLQVVHVALALTIVLLIQYLSSELLSITQPRTLLLVHHPSSLHDVRLERDGHP